MIQEQRANYIAVLFDFDNVAIGVEQYYSNQKFSVDKVMSTIRERGRIIIKKAYADWKQWQGYTNNLLNSAIDMVHLPRHGGSNKNHADIKMAVDAMEIVHRNPIIDTFVLVSGDSDFSALVTALRENGKYVVTIGVREATSNLLIFNSDEFISYEAIMGIGQKKDLQGAHQLLNDVIVADNSDRVKVSSINEKMLQMDPTFNWREYGFRQFKSFLRSAEKSKLIKISGTPGVDEWIEIADDAGNTNKNGRK